ncbi:MAG: ABC transporter ATP-binding protein [Actinomycetaceae bacterium]|nr:ABC transporter ATP-binding protein [Actinomycetaceae bacterium]
MSVLEPISPPSDVVVRATKLTKIYGKGDTAVTALRSIDVEIGRGEFTAIMGPSGSGKSTLMHCLAGLDSITDGKIVLDNVTISTMSERKLTKLRREKIGFIFQSFNLIPTLTARENITLPADISKRPVSRERFNQVIEAVGLGDRLSHRPAELSGGQQQRVACARALVTNPAVVFADEPTGNLDSKSSAQVLKFLRHAVDEFNQTVVMVTHEPDAAAWADRVLFLVDGEVVAQLSSPHRDAILDALRELGDAPDIAETTPDTEDSPHPTPTAGVPAGDLAMEYRETSTEPPHSSDTEDTPPPSTSEVADPYIPIPGETLGETLRRIAPARKLDPETTSLLEEAVKILEELPGPVVPENENDFTGPIPLVEKTSSTHSPADDSREPPRA